MKTTKFFTLPETPMTPLVWYGCKEFGRLDNVGPHWTGLSTLNSRWVGQESDGGDWHVIRDKVNVALKKNERP